MLHIYGTRLKIILRQKSNLFWTLLFPIILSIFFFMALTNAYSGNSLDTIDIALVNNAAQEDTGFAMLDSTLKDIEFSNENKIFHITQTSEEDAKRLLKDDTIIGYVIYDNGLNLVVNSSGIYQSITKSVLDTYAKNANIFHTLLVLNGGTVDDAAAQAVYNGGNYVVSINSLESEPDLVLNHYYSLIAMACLFGSMYGLKEITDIQANLSAKGARLNVSPANKIKTALSSILAAYTIQMASILLLIAFLRFVLNVDFGSKTLLIVLTCATGSLTGVLMGTTVAALSKKNEAAKSSILTGISMLGCFLAGLMAVQMKYIIAEKVPFLQYINPANLITDALYRLYYYNSLNQFFIDIVILCILNVLLAAATFCFTRRSQYANL